MKIKLQKSKCIVCEIPFNYIKGFTGEKGLCFKCFLSYEKHERQEALEELVKDQADVMLLEVLEDMERRLN